MTATLQAPPRRPLGLRRGAAIAAAIGSVAAVWTVSTISFGGWSGGGAITTRDVTVEYSYGGSGSRTLDVTATLLGLALAAAALALWAARDRRVVLAGWATCAIAAGTTVAVSLDRKAQGWVTTQEIVALETGTSRTAVLDRLGKPAGEATVSGPGSAGLDCVVYLRRTREDHAVQPLCFRDGRLISPELHA